MNTSSAAAVRIQRCSLSISGGGSTSETSRQKRNVDGGSNHHHHFHHRLAPKKDGTKGAKVSVSVPPAKTMVASISTSSSASASGNAIVPIAVGIGAVGTAAAIALRSKTTTSAVGTKAASNQTMLQHVVDGESELAKFNEETKKKYANFPEIVREDAHVYKDADGYYVVKEEWRKPTNPFEKLKLAKDAMKTVIALNEIKTLGDKSGSTKEDFEKFEKELGDGDEIDHRLKWAGLFHRRKGHYGRFMMRLKLPGGLVSSEQMKYLASLVQSYGDDGCADITTRQNIQMRGIQLKDAHDIMINLERLKMCSLQSGLDNARNATGSPIAGIDPLEIIDTRPFTDKIQEYVTGGGRGNPEIAN